MPTDPRTPGSAWSRGFGIEGPSGWWNQYGRPAWVATGWQAHPRSRGLTAVDFSSQLHTGSASDAWDWPPQTADRRD